MMIDILNQLKSRRKELKLKQKDMMLRVGMSRQQYQQLEANGNPRLDTLLLLAKGLKCELMLIPYEKLLDIQQILEAKSDNTTKDKPAVSDDPWKDILGDDK